MLSCEFFTWNVVHGQVVHVCLDELKCLVFDVLDCLVIEFLSQVLNLLACDALAVLSCLETFDNDRDHIGETLDALSHAQAEIAEPLVVKTNSPVLREELNNVGDYTSVKSASQCIEVVLVKANK